MPIIQGWDTDEAREYIKYNAIDFEDTLDIDDDVLVNRLNVARRVLLRRYKGAFISLEACYLFCAVLSAAYNDTMVFQKRGVSNFNVDGISFSFQKWSQSNDLTDLISDDIKDIIQEDNPDIDFGNGRIKWVTM